MHEEMALLRLAIDAPRGTSTATDSTVKAPAENFLPPALPTPPSPNTASNSKNNNNGAANLNDSTSTGGQNDVAAPTPTSPPALLPVKAAGATPQELARMKALEDENNSLRDLLREAKTEISEFASTAEVAAKKSASG